MSTRLARRTARGAVIALLASPLALLAPLTPAASAADVTDGLLLRYDLTQTSGTVVTDSSGNGRDGTLSGGGTWTGTTGLTLDGVDDHVKLPNNVLAGLSSVTVSSDVFIEPSQAGNYFLWGLGNPAVGSPASGSGYLMASGNTFRASITNTWWNNEKNTAPSPARNLARGVWKTVTYTQTGTTGTLYEDGVQVGQNTNVTVLPSAIGNGTTTNNVLGESNYAADNSLKGKVKNFRIYDRALTAAEVADISLTDANRLSSDTDALEPRRPLGRHRQPHAADHRRLRLGDQLGVERARHAITSTGAVTRPGAGADPAAGHPDRHAHPRLRDRDADLRRDRPPRRGRPVQGRRGRRRARARAPRRRTRSPHAADHRDVLLDRHLGLLGPGDRRARRHRRPARARRRRRQRHPDRDGHRRRRHRHPAVPAHRAAGARPGAVRRLCLQLLHRQLDRRREDLLRRQPRQQRAALGRAQRRPAGARLDVRRDGPARPVPHPLPRGRPLLPHRHRPLDRPQRRLGPLAAPGQPLPRDLGVHRPDELVGAAPRPGLPADRGQHLGPGGLLGRRPAAVRRLLGLEALRRGRPRPHRQHLQPDALRHDARLRDLQRGQDLAGHRLLADRLHGDQGGRHLLPLHQGRGRRQHRLLRHHPGEERQPHRARPRRRQGVGLPGRLHRPRRRHLGRRGPDRLQAQPRRHLGRAVLPLRRRVRRPRLHPADHRRPRGPRLEGAGRLQAARQPAPRHGPPGHPGRARRAARRPPGPAPAGPEHRGRAGRGVPADRRRQGRQRSRLRRHGHRRRAPSPTAP